MSPVFILSRLCLKRRFQFFGISVDSPESALTTTSTASRPITQRRPTFSAFSVGTLTVMSLCRILMVRYSRSCPRTMRDSLLTTVPAPWCGYTTLSPTSNKLALPLSAHFTKTAGAERLPARERHSSGDSPCMEANRACRQGQTTQSGDLRDGGRRLEAGRDCLAQRLGPRDARA